MKLEAPWEVIPKVCLVGASWLLATILVAPASRAQTEAVPNSDFDKGDAGPQHWTLSGGNGRWADRQILEVAGEGQDSNYWRCDDCRLNPGSLYRFQMRARRLSGAGTVICGPSFANRDFTTVSGDWRWYDYVFYTPSDNGESYLRLGQWHCTGKVQFDAVRLCRALAVHKQVGPFFLGEGESIRSGKYTFHGAFDYEGGNFHRPLVSATAGFNSNRWVFGGESQVTYRFGLPGHKILAGKIGFSVNHHTGGGCTAEVGRDAAAWRPLATQNAVGQAEAALPADVLPADEVYLRLRSSSPAGSFQVDQIQLEAELDGQPPEAFGDTSFASIENAEPSLTVEAVSLTEGERVGLPILQLTLSNRMRRDVRVTLSGHIRQEEQESQRLEARQANVAAGRTATLEVPLPAEAPGQREITISLSGAGGATTTLSLEHSTHDYHRSDYGQLISGLSGKAAVWWCDAAHKVSPERALPAAASPAARLSAAKNDFEAVQVIVQPSEPLQGLTATASDLTGAGGGTITSDHVRILRVAYHYVHTPTDSSSIRGRWPDALPPLSKKLSVPAHENQPLWVLIHVPEDAKAGEYTGHVSLNAEGWSASVPIKLRVWDFALPQRNHLETAFGFSTGDVFRYHQLKSESDQRRVLDLYFQSFSEHRISPYDLTPLDPIQVKFLPDADPPRAEVDFTAFDKAMARAVDEFHFTNFRLSVQGMGGGTFHARSEPRIERFGEETPQYQSMFSSYTRQLQDHLREKGWLKMAYVYWFDEPAPRDYEFVINGMQRLHKYAPGLQRMLTEEPGDELAGSVDIWCPVSNRYEHEPAELRRRHGERSWWYVCTGPKAPYCTLFIDHPATELRVWLWQTWQRNIVGILVWRANYWTSSAAYPDFPQNPYEDPMGWRTGYSTPRGAKRPWGNGDGRFIYPPETAAVPGASGTDPVLDPPVSSIRWEMLREGIEDYEFLYMLRELLAKKRDRLSPTELAKYEDLLKVPETITKDMITFTTDPAPIYTRRAAIAHAIEELGR